ncbi:MAG: hypothetical protein IJ622_10675 [Bacteroidales bacterium]|nr:hypothetical protein [Bacteroidales bacterium]
MNKQGYSVLVIGYNCYQGHVGDFIRNWKKANPLVTITLLTNRSKGLFSEDALECVSRFVRIVPYTGAIKNKRIRKFIGLWRFVKKFVSLSRESYDFVNIHYPTPRVHHAIFWIKRMTKNVIVTPWGSDVLRVEKESLIKKLKKIYNAATCVFVDPESQLGKEVVAKFECDPKKILPICWGLEFVDFIKESRPVETVEESKARFGLEDRYVVTCGYNSRLAQRHEAIVDAVAKVKEDLPENLTLLFPFTYGRLPWTGYDRWILDKCSQYEIKGAVISEFLNNKDMYLLRNATDMFVHVQTTDAASACVMQYILCNKKIVHGSWMKYNELEQFKPLFYYPVDCIEDLPNVLLMAYQSDPIQIPQGVIDTIMSKGWGGKMRDLNAYCESKLEKRLA